MEFKEIKPVVYLESETSSLFLELPIEIQAYREILAALDATALPEGQSKDFIGDLAVELYGDREIRGAYLPYSTSMSGLRRRSASM
jgi:hypothetical protein